MKSVMLLVLKITMYMLMGLEANLILWLQLIHKIQVGWDELNPCQK